MNAVDHNLPEDGPAAADVSGARTVTRADLAAAAYKYANLSRRAAEAIVDEVLAEIVDGLIVDGEVKLQSFGVFTVYAKPDRIGRNPKTGELHPIGARRVVRFRPSLIMRNKVADKA